MASEFKYDYIRPLIPNGRRRAPWHDYRSRCIYMITMNAAPGIPPFSMLAGELNSRDYPPTTIRTPLGEIIHQQISAIKKKFPFVKILRRIVMPEHIHFVIFIEVADKCHLSDIISLLKVTIGQLWSRAYGIYSTIFEEGYHDRILIGKGQLKKMLNYVSNNPRRRMERIAYRGFHSRYNISDVFGCRYEAYGNIHLLEDCDISNVKISSHDNMALLKKKKTIWKQTVENCGVLVSPFISAAQKKVRDWSMDNGGRLILIEGNGFGHIYSPKGKLHDLCNQGRLLIIAPTTHSTANIKYTRQMCEDLNNIASEIAEGKIRRI